MRLKCPWEKAMTGRPEHCAIGQLDERGRRGRPASAIDSPPGRAVAEQIPTRALGPRIWAVVRPS